MTRRLSISSLAGTARTVVAVGTLNEASMLAATALAGPRSLTTVSSAGFSLAGPSSLRSSGCARMGRLEAAPSLLSASVSTPSGRPFALAPVAAGAGDCARSVVWGVCFRAAGSEARAGEASGFFAAGADAAVVAEALPAGAEFVPPGAEALSSSAICSKMGHHFLSTEFLSAWYFSKSSSTSHSLPANSSGIRWCGWSGTSDTPLPSVLGVPGGELVLAAPVRLPRSLPAVGALDGLRACKAGSGFSV